MRFKMSGVFWFHTGKKEAENPENMGQDRHMEPGTEFAL